MSRRKVLVVTSSSETLTLRDGKRMRTGYFLSELAIPLMRIMEAGFTPVFANPAGNEPPMDPRSDNPLWFKGNWRLHAMSKRMLRELDAYHSPRTLNRVIMEGLGEYSGLFVPGGHASMEDLPFSRPMARILEHFYDEGKPVGMICHGPAALLSSLEDPERFVAALESGDVARARKLAASWRYRGYRMTAFSNREESGRRWGDRLRGRKPGHMRFLLEDALRVAGAEVEIGLTEIVRRDRELVTGQGPFAAGRFARLFVDALYEERATHLIRRAA